MVFDQGTVEECRAMLLRWNNAAAAAGCVGSEFVDDPERVFECLASRQRMKEKMAHRKGSFGIPLKQDDNSQAPS